MTPEEIEAIRTFWLGTSSEYCAVNLGFEDIANKATDDIPKLIAEIDRLKAGLATIIRMLPHHSPFYFHEDKCTHTLCETIKEMCDA